MSMVTWHLFVKIEPYTYIWNEYLYILFHFLKNFIVVVIVYKFQWLFSPNNLLYIAFATRGTRPNLD